MPAAHILVVDDESDIRMLVGDILRDEGYQVSLAKDAEEARQERRARRPDLVLLDIWMPGTDGIGLLKEWSEEGQLPFPTIMMSGHGSIETAVEATKLGAFDFIEKPLSLAKLLLTVEHALEIERLARESLERGTRMGPSEPLGHSQIMQSLRDSAKKIAQHDSPVLICGEPGSGKETLARYIHHLSARQEAPFVVLNLSAVAQENIEIELFGSEEDGLYYGRLEQAHGGTLFLAEVADMDNEQQTRLLSALEQMNFLRVGGSEPVKINVRVIAGTKCRLDEAVAAGHFRNDLYYYLNVLPLSTPALQDHSEDVPELVQYFSECLVEQDGLPKRLFTGEALGLLQNYQWPGNVRELINVVQRLLILGSGDTVGANEVNQALGSVLSAPVAEMDIPLDIPLREAREKFERDYLSHQFQQVGGSMGELARVTGMERTHLYRKLKALGIERPKNVEDITE